MPLSWSDRERIARALIETYPTTERLKLSLDDLQQMVVTLPDFTGPENPPKRAHLESILWTWMRLADDTGEGAAA
ncbi:MAG: Iron-sulfur cluster assembly [Alphaproteobacteria bacterium]|jgi:FeS assembly protein IscX|nr:Iron-sulfur cluster assembly [Alphaproteobacteria bacterium]